MIDPVRSQSPISSPASSNINSSLLPPTAAKKNTESPKQASTDFRQLLLDSNSKAKESREMDGDSLSLEKAEDYESFLKMLNKQTEKSKLPKNTLGKDDFLKLFVSQIQNQDPLDPKDGAEMASQLAQFNSLEQMLNMNQGLEQLASQIKKGHKLSLVEAIGKGIRVSDGRVLLTKNGPSEAKVVVNDGVIRSHMKVKDDNGNLVTERDLGSLPPGEHQLPWDGKTTENLKASPGIYHVSIEGEGKNGHMTKLTVVSQVKIKGINMDGPSPTFLTSLGAIDSDETQELVLISEQPSQPLQQQVSKESHKSNNPETIEQNKLDDNPTSGSNTLPPTG